MSASAIVSKDGQPPNGLRPVNIRTDLVPIAELIEICFAPTMDDAARAAIRERRLIGESGPLTQLFYGLDRLLGGLEQGFVWVENGRLVGNVTFSPAGYPSAMGTGYIVANVAVHPEFRRRGIARALVTATLERLRQIKATFAVLQVDASNQGARHLYANLGFREERGFIRWYRPSHLRPPYRLDEMPFITLREGAEWEEEYNLARLVRPNDQGGLGWLRPTHQGMFRPSIWRTLGNIFTGTSSERWVVRKDSGQGIAASLHAQTSFGGAHRLELLVHPGYQGKLELPLLNYILRRFEGQHRPVQIEHPSDDDYTSAALDSYGFERRHAFIDMRRDWI